MSLPCKDGAETLIAKVRSKKKWLVGFNKLNFFFLPYNFYFFFLELRRVIAYIAPQSVFTLVKSFG
jgi:hypothetical protein